MSEETCPHNSLSFGYNYVHCNVCDTTWWKDKVMSEKDYRDCPKCGAKAMHWTLDPFQKAGTNLKTYQTLEKRVERLEKQQSITRSQVVDNVARFGHIEDQDIKELRERVERLEQATKDKTFPENPECDHEWIVVGHNYATRGLFCTKCKTIRPD